MEGLSAQSIGLVIIALLWVLPWKAYSLWTAAKLAHKRWFIALVLLNTFALLDIFYIFYIAKKTPKDFIRALKNVFKK
ncbi:MAG: DUF5652 family protein [Candidatus Paceibacterota bacterium]